MNKILSDIDKQLKYSLGVEGHEVTVDQVEVLDECDSASVDAIETVGDHAEVQDLNNDAEDLQNTLTDGEELITAVESAVVSKKGLTPFESVALKMAVRQLTGRYSSIPEDNLPAREAFGGTDDALDTTVLALEGLKESFQTFWEATKNQFLKIIEAIQKIFRNIVQRFTSTKKRAIALRARLHDDPVDAESESKTIQMVTDNLQIGNEEIGSAVTGGMNLLLDVLVELLKNTRNVDDRAEVNKGVESLKEENIWTDYVNGVNSNAKRTFDAISHVDESTTSMLPGSRAITFTEGQPGTRDQFSFESFVDFKEGKGANQGKEQTIPVLTGKQITIVCDHIILIADEIEKYDKVWSRSSSKAARLVQGINAAAKGDISKIEEEESTDDAAKQEKESRLTKFKINVSALINHVRRLDKFSSDLISYAQLVSNDALAYGEKSLEAIRSTTTETK